MRPGRSRLLLSLLLFWMLCGVAAAQGSGFSLPGIDDLEKQLTGDGDNADTQKEGEPTPERTLLEETLKLRKEIDANHEQIKKLEQQQNALPREKAALQDELEKIRRESTIDWAERYQSLSISALAEELGQKLQVLERNQEKLAATASDVTSSQTLPERAQNTISDSLAEADDIRRQLNRPSVEETLSEMEVQNLQVKLAVLDSRIELRNQELAVASASEQRSRLQQRVLEADAELIQKQLDVLQPLINQRRQQQLQDELQAASVDLPAEVADHPELAAAEERNKALRKQLVQTSEEVNDLLRENVATKTQLDRVRALSTTVNDQIRMLDGSLLLSRILYEQQKNLPDFKPREGLPKAIGDTRLRQFEISQQRQQTEASIVRIDDQDISPEDRAALQDALGSLHDIHVELLNQLDTELGRKLNLLVRLNLVQDQLGDVSRNLHDTISEQTFWMPSTQPINLSWLREFPAQVRDQINAMPWLRMGKDALALLKDKWPWLLLPATFAAALMWWRRRLRTRIRKLNSDIGFLRRDSQLHTPLAILMTALMCAPGPLVLSLLAWGLWIQPGTLSTVLGAALLKVALLWLVFEMCYRLLARDGIAQRHFRWSADGNTQLRRRLLAVGLAMVPMTLIIAFGEQWPAQLNNDRIGLVIMVFGLAVMGIMLTRVALHFPITRFSTAYKTIAALVCGGLPFALIVVIGLGYYYTTVRLSGRIIDSFYLLLLWTLIDATAVRGLAVAAQRLAYKRALAQRDSDAKETSVEGIEVEEPQLDLERVNQQSLRLIRMALVVVFGLLFYWVWADILSAFSYTENILLWETTEGSGSTLTQVPISLGDVMFALAATVVTLMLALNLPGLLEVLLLSRMNLKQGSSYATTTLLSYVIIALGVMVVLGSLGLTWNKLQWLVAALGVGLGFGLQQIFANFVSGIIILFERPIRIGDVITIGTLSGTVSRVRVRATTVIDFDRKEIIIPNQTFVTEQLINWSLSDTVTRLIITVGFAYGSDLSTCREILQTVARDHPKVMKDPEPMILFMGFGASTLDHELRVYVKEIGDRLSTTDELNRRIDQLCRERGVEIAFSQMDIHIRSINGGDNLTIPGERRESGNGDPTTDA
ncbi:transporter [Alcanivorax sp. KX64203]|nr:transporter [Alcanivorax sp. KX64203]